MPPTRLKKWRQWVRSTTEPTAFPTKINPNDDLPMGDLSLPTAPSNDDGEDSQSEEEVLRILARYEPSVGAASNTSSEASSGPLPSTSAVAGHSPFPDIPGGCSDDDEDIMDFVQSLLVFEMDEIQRETEERNRRLRERQQATLNDIEAMLPESVDDALSNHIDPIPDEPLEDEQPAQSKIANKAYEMEEENVNMPMCPICLERQPHSEMSITYCGHAFCPPCITASVKRCKKCPSCRAPLTMKKITKRVHFQY